MHGNVDEWCEDVYDESFYGKTAATEKNPVCTSGSKYRVVRGGGWYYYATNCRSANRSFYHPGYRDLFLGFRPSRPFTP